MAVKEILRLGNPGLWKVCESVKDAGAPRTKKIICDLKDTLENFKKKNGFGRAIAAPQIRELKKIIFINFPKAKLSGAMINPKIIKKSKEKVRIWDDCFSFPDLLVKVERARDIEVEYLDATGKKQRLIARGDLSELLQHEIDHLDGVLAIERAINGKSFFLREQCKKRKNKS